MRKNIFVYLFLVIVLLNSCGTPKQIIQYDQLAIQSSETGNYQQAIAEWNQYLEAKKQLAQEPDPKAYAELGKAHFLLEQFEQAESEFDMARNKNYADPTMYVMMSERYRMIDNLSKEITALEYYRDHFPADENNSMMRNRLFESYIKSENWEDANNTWIKMDSISKEEETHLQEYFTLNKKLEQTEICDQLAQQLLSKNSQNAEALEWLAKKYYNLAEDQYQSSMAAYEKNKTNKQYKILLKELDDVTANFKKSLKYFEPLWDMPDGKKYASYLANIYARFDDKKKSDYYKSFLK